MKLTPRMWNRQREGPSSFHAYQHPDIRWVKSPLYQFSVHFEIYFDVFEMIRVKFSDFSAKICSKSSRKCRYETARNQIENLEQNRYEWPRYFFSTLDWTKKVNEFETETHISCLDFAQKLLPARNFALNSNINSHFHNRLLFRLFSANFVNFSWPNILISESSWKRAENSRKGAG